MSRSNQFLLSILTAVLLAGAVPESARAQSVSYEYDPAGRLARAEYDSGWIITYSYDSAGNLQGRDVTQPDLDGGQDADGGVETDTGPDAGEDAGADEEPEVDAGVDAGPATDDGQPGDGDEGGCGCRSGPGSRWSSLGLLSLGLLLFLRRRRAILSAVLVLVVSGYGLEARAVTVCEEGCDKVTIEEGLAEVWGGGEVIIFPGTYNESDLGVANDVIVRSSDPQNPSAVVVDGGGNDTVFMVGSNVVFAGITIQNGRAAPDMIGGDAFGGAIYGSGEKLVIRKCIIQNNHAEQGGGIFYGRDTVIIESIIQNNTAEEYGGGVRVSGTTLIIDSRILNNVIQDTDNNIEPRGGGINIASGKLYMHNTTVYGNQVINTVGANGATGGGISGGWQGTELNLMGCTIEANIVRSDSGPAEGGGIGLLAPVTMIGGTLGSNHVYGGTHARGGGLITSNGNVTRLQGVTITGNLASEGGGIFETTSWNTNRYLDCDISGNEANLQGGGMYCESIETKKEWTSEAGSNSPDNLYNCAGCTPGNTQACVTGLPAPCSNGTQTCGANGMWGLCAPDNPPQPEICDDSIDNDCDGRMDLGDLDCEGSTTTGNHKGSGKKGDPVDAYTGELFTAEPPDLFLGGPLPLYFSRYYASGLSGQGVSGTLGTNWRHIFEWTLVDLGDTVEIVNDEGRKITFSDTGDSTFTLTGRLDIPWDLLLLEDHYYLNDPVSELIYVFDPAGLLVGIEDHFGNALTLTWAAGELTDVDDGLGRCLTLFYSGGKLTEVTDGTRSVVFSYTGEDLTSVADVRGFLTSYSYDAGGLLTARTRPENNTPYTQTWDADSRVATQSDALGNTHNFTYLDGSTEILDPDSGTSTLEHGEGGYLTSMSGADGMSVSFSYDQLGRRSSLTDREGDLSSVSYHGPSGKVSSITYPNGETIAFYYLPVYSGWFPRYELSRVEHPDGTLETYEFDEFTGNLLVFTDRSGETWSWDWNDRGQVLTTTNPANGVSTFAYNPDGSVASEEDHAGNITGYTYDDLGRISRIDAPDGSFRLMTWDDDDNLLTLTDPKGSLTTFTYDRNGNLETIQDRLGRLTTLTWDDMDRLTGFEDPLTNVAQFGYDSQERLASVTNQSGNSKSFHYDNRGRLAAIEDGAGLMWARTWDAEGILLTASDPLDNTWTFTSNNMGLITGIESPLGHTESIDYDPMGRVTTVTDAVGQVRTWTYDARGDVTGDGQGGVEATYEHDALGSVTLVTTPDGSGWSYTYDQLGRLTSVADPLNNTTSYEYDPMGRPDRVVFPGSLGDLVIIHDENGNTTQEQYSDGLVLLFGWDAMDRMTTADSLDLQRNENGLITDSNGMAITHEPTGRIESVTFDTGKTVTYTYGTRNQLAQVTDWLGGETTFSYDDAGRCVGMSRPNGVDVTFSWNEDGDLVGIDEGALSSISLTRDAVGRVVAADLTLPESGILAPAQDSFTFDQACQVQDFSYDALGRLLADDSREYTWDLASRLSSINEGGESTAFTYDGLGYRTSRTAAGVTRTHVWNHALVLPAVSIVRQGGNDLRYYVHTPRGMLLYSIEAGGAGDTRSYYHFDEMGNTLYTTDSAGAITASYAYTPFGQLTGESGAADNPFTWQGAWGVMREGEKGLYYMRARYYDSTSMRFISRDPVETMDPKAINPYQYAFHNPVLGIDPTGEQVTSIGARPLRDMQPIKVKKMDAFSFAVGTYGAVFDDLVIDPYKKRLEAQANSRAYKNRNFWRHKARMSKLGKWSGRLGRLALVKSIYDQIQGHRKDRETINNRRRIQMKLLTQRLRQAEAEVRKIAREKKKSPEWLHNQLRNLESNYNYQLQEMEKSQKTESCLAVTKRGLKMLGALTPVPENWFDDGFRYIERNNVNFKKFADVAQGVIPWGDIIQDIAR